jgi:adenylate cyclase
MTEEIKARIEKLERGNRVLRKKLARSEENRATMEESKDKYDMLYQSVNKALEVRNRFIRETFGRYLSDEIVDNILETPDGVKLGGEKRHVSIMITDLRGFTALSESLEPEQVVRMLNRYFEVMVDIIQPYNGTINEIRGDSLLVIFGAPHEIQDRAQSAIACAIAMQNAMAKVNEENGAVGLPELEMGIGLHDSEVIVGNLGSSKRLIYSVVGSGVNMASRIESYTVGGQILVSESIRKEAGKILRIDGQRDVLPKGAEDPLRIFAVGGIAGKYNLALEGRDLDLVALTRRVPLRYSILEGKNVGEKSFEGFASKLSKRSAELTLDGPIDLLSNIKMNLVDVYAELAVKDFYGKVIDRSEKDAFSYVIRFTSIPLEVVSYMLAHQQYAADPPVDKSEKRGKTGS